MASRTVEGLETGSKFDVKATAEEAFGPYDPDQIVELDRDIFVVEGKFDAHRPRCFFASMN